LKEGWTPEKYKETHSKDGVEAPIKGVGETIEIVKDFLRTKEA